MCSEERHKSTQLIVEYVELIGRGVGETWDVGACEVDARDAQLQHHADGDGHLVEVGSVVSRPDGCVFLGADEA